MRRRADGFLLSLAPAGAVLLAAVAAAQPAEPIQHSLVEPGPEEWTTLYATGERVLVPTHTRWKLICGSDDASITREEFRQIVEQTKAAAAQAHDEGLATRGGLDLIFNTGGAIPAQAPAAIAAVESYIESRFSDPITVTISINFASMSGGVLGATGSQFVTNSYNNTRNGLVNDMDPDDVIQASLPPGTTIPVRYNGSSTTVTNENAISATRANHRAAIGSVSGLAASMTINTNVNWDWDPSNGVGFRTCFQSVLVHEVGHALGFVSNADGFGADMDLLDMYRFQRSDGANDYNPDTLEEFATTPRLVDFNNPDDDHISDIISAEYRMSDGNPWQASHFREQSSNIGIMDPALAGGQTFYPSFYRTSDLNMLDAIGWDYPPVAATPAPIAVDDILSATENQPLLIAYATLLANDSDPDDDPLNLTAFTQPINGSLVDNGDETFTYTPPVAFVGTDRFTYTLTDDDGSDTATVTINVAAAPTIYRVDPAAVGAGTGLTWADALTTLDAALDMADQGDTIWVAAGAYAPGGTGRTATFNIPAGVALYGAFPNGGGDNTFNARDPGSETLETILSGDLAANDHTGDRTDNAYHVVTIASQAVTLDGFTISGGMANGSSSSQQDRGAGILVSGAAPTLANLMLLDNHASFIGGGLFATESSPTMIDCLLLGNSSPRGGGAAFSNGSPALINIAASGNHSSSDGAALYFAGANALLTSATCTDNTAGSAAIAATANATLQLSNTILHDNAARSLALTSGAAAEVDHCLLQGGQGGVLVASASLTWLDGNIDALPALVDQRGADGLPGTGDENFTPGPGSPAIDAGNNDANALAEDLSGGPRRVDAVNYPDVGAGTAPLIDIGAIEAPADTAPLPPQTCPCETDGDDGQVNVFDLLAYLDLWFASDQGAERTGDDPASVDVFDLLSFLDCWFPASAGAPCP